ncbi:hypothetical protein C1H46_014242 [Malus baccata]|uniref:Uncharacterized protein n=1 Tax=Malus baccata TaxID=106549 RepID=A0A540MN10_MALBA|nr:hypothetical protein C1H46_014242 [Malus baccata]
MQRLRSSGTLLSSSQAITRLRKKAFRSWAAVQDTYFSIKDIFEGHKVVFTVGTSIASVATAWFGYTLRHLHESRVDQRLESIEKVMKNNHNLEQSEIRNIMDSGTIGLPSCIATAGTTLVIGYTLGWRGGRWYANRKFRREQMKLLGQIKPKRWPLLRRIEPKVWQFQFLRRPLTRQRTQDNPVKTSEKIRDTLVAHEKYLRNVRDEERNTLLKKPWYVNSEYDTVILFCESAVGTRTKLFSANNVQDAASAFAPSPGDDGICATMVATQGYACEEHTGTLVALAAISKDLQLKNLRSAVLLSPIAYADQMPSPLARAVAENFIAEALYNADLRQFNLKRKAAVEVLKAVCRKPGVDCTHWLTAFTVNIPSRDRGHSCLDSSFASIHILTSNSNPATTSALKKNGCNLAMESSVKKMISPWFQNHMKSALLLNEVSNVGYKDADEGGVKVDDCTCKLQQFREHFFLDSRRLASAKSNDGKGYLVQGTEVLKEVQFRTLKNTCKRTLAVGDPKQQIFHPFRNTTTINW